MFSMKAALHLFFNFGINAVGTATSSSRRNLSLAATWKTAQLGRIWSKLQLNCTIISQLKSISNIVCNDDKRYTQLTTGWNVQLRSCRLVHVLTFSQFRNWDVDNTVGAGCAIFAKIRRCLHIPIGLLKLPHSSVKAFWSWRGALCSEYPAQTSQHL